MASASARKKSNKRLISNSKPQQSPPMSSSSLAFPPSFRKLILSIPIALICMVTVFFSASSISQKAFESNGRSSNFYTVEVINEFSHDPEAFTQVLVPSMYSYSIWLPSVSTIFYRFIFGRYVYYSFFGYFSLYLYLFLHVLFICLF